MNPPGKPLPPDPNSGSSPRVWVIAALAILAGVVVIFGTCCGGVLLVAGLSAKSVRQEQRPEAIDADREVAAAFEEATIAVNEATAELSQSSEEAKKAVGQRNETLDKIGALLLEHDVDTPAPAEAEAQLRTWTRGDFTLQAAFVRVEGKDVILRKTDGMEISVPLDELSAGDQCVATMSAPMSAPLESDIQPPSPE